MPILLLLLFLMQHVGMMPSKSTLPHALFDSWLFLISHLSVTMWYIISVTSPTLMHDLLPTSSFLLVLASIVFFYFLSSVFILILCILRDPFSSWFWRMDRLMLPPMFCFRVASNVLFSSCSTVFWVSLLNISSFFIFFSFFSCFLRSNTKLESWESAKK